MPSSSAARRIFSATESALSYALLELSAKAVPAAMPPTVSAAPTQATGVCDAHLKKFSRGPLVSTS